MQTATQSRGAAQDIFLTGPQVQRRYQKSHVSIWRWINDETLGFPPPLKINRLNYWRLADLEAWEAKQAGQG
jgi:predicted DNA-binding transcriptional regulator AlpA